MDEIAQESYFHISLESNKIHMSPSISKKLNAPLVNITSTTHTYITVYTYQIIMLLLYAVA